MQTQVQEKPVEDKNVEAEDDSSSSDDEEETTKVPLKERIIKYAKKTKRDTKYLIFHRTKGRSYFCSNTCGFWCSQLFFLIFLYVVLTGFFLAYMAIGSEMMPFTFFFLKYRDPNDVPAPLESRQYFGSSNNTNSTK